MAEERGRKYQKMKLDIADHLTSNACKDIGLLIGLRPGQIESCCGCGRDLLQEMERQGKLGEEDVSELRTLLVDTKNIQATAIIDAYQKLLNDCTQEPELVLNVSRGCDTTDGPDYSGAHMQLLVTEAQLSLLADQLGSRWRAFCLQKLELTKVEIDYCEYDRSPGGLHDVIFGCLNKWRQKNGSACTAGRLVELLVEFGFGREVWGVLESPE